MPLPSKRQRGRPAILPDTPENLERRQHWNQKARARAARLKKDRELRPQFHRPGPLVAPIFSREMEPAEGKDVRAFSPAVEVPANVRRLFARQSFWDLLRVRGEKLREGIHLATFAQEMSDRSLVLHVELGNLSALETLLAKYPILDTLYREHPAIAPTKELLHRDLEDPGGMDPDAVPFSPFSPGPVSETGELPETTALQVLERDVQALLFDALDELLPPGSRHRPRLLRLRRAYSDLHRGQPVLEPDAEPPKLCGGEPVRERAPGEVPPGFDPDDDRTWPEEWNHRWCGGVWRDGQRVPAPSVPTDPRLCAFISWMYQASGDRAYLEHVPSEDDVVAIEELYQQALHLVQDDAGEAFALLDCWFGGYAQDRSALLAWKTPTDLFQQFGTYCRTSLPPGTVPRTPAACVEQLARDLAPYAWG